MRLIRILIALCLIKKSLQMVESYEEKTTLVNGLVCVNAALRTYLQNHRNIRIFSTISNSPVQSLVKVPLIVITEWDLLREGLSVDRGPVIIFLEGNGDLDFSGLERLRDIVMAEPVIIVCITDVVCGSEIYKTKIVETVASEEMHYVAVDEEGTIDVYERTTTSEGNCGVAWLLRRGHCSDKSTAKNVFQTAVNFHGCPLRVVTWPRPLYSKKRKTDDLSELPSIEGSVVEVLAEKVNATCVLLTTPNPDDVRRLVASRDVDLGYGGLDTRSFEGVSYSNPYMFVQATFVATHSTWTIERSLTNIFEPLGTQVWMGIVVTILLIWFLQRLVPYFRRICALQLLGIFLGVPLPKQPRRLPSRIYFFSLVLFGYICSQSYLTNLTKALSTPQQQLIRTLDDLEHSSVPVTGPVDSRVRFKVDYPRIYNDFKGEDFSEYYDSLAELLLKGRSSSAYYVEEIDRRITDWKAVEALRDRFNWYSVAFAAPNTSAILTVTNKVFSRLDQGGILTGSGSSITAKAKDDAHTSSERTVVLELEALKGIFVLHSIGLGLSLLVFVIEILMPFIKKKTELRSIGEIQPEWSRRRRGHDALADLDGNVSLRRDVDS